MRDSPSVQHAIRKDRGSSRYRSRCSTDEKYVDENYSAEGRDRYGNKVSSSRARDIILP